MVESDDAQEAARLRRENAALRDQAAHQGERALRLQQVTAHLSSALTDAEVAAIVVAEGTGALGASSGALWRLEPAAGALVLLRAHNYPDDAVALVQRLPLDVPAPVAEAARTGRGVWLASREDYAARFPISAERTRDFAAPVTFAVASLPLVLDGRVLGAMSLSFPSAREFSADERGFLEMLAWHCAQGLERARLYAAEHAARRRAEIAQERAVFLSRASELLGSSLDYEETLRNVARLAVPHLADWCGVELLGRDGVARQVAVEHIDPAKIELAHELRRRYPPDPAAPTGVPNVIRTGRSELYPEIPDELLVAGTVDAEHLRIARELGLRSAMTAAIRDRSGVVGAISFVLSDGERRYTVEDLLMAEQLGERAGAAIANARLYDEVKRSVELRDEFLAIAGHELRTPVTTISLHLQSLLRLADDAPAAKVRERVKKLVGQGDRLIALIEDLLDVTKLAAGRVELDRADCDLAAIVGEVAERLRDDLDRSSTQLELKGASARGHWDAARLDQIASNLLGNALKYGKGRPVTVEVAAGDGAATLTVTDRGIGIALEDQGRIFERFERAVSSRNFGGFGLGLWIVRQLVEAHGGTVTVASVPGEGATFTVTLPR